MMEQHRLNRSTIVLFAIISTLVVILLTVFTFVRIDAVRRYQALEQASAANLALTDCMERIKQGLTSGTIIVTDSLEQIDEQNGVPVAVSIRRTEAVTGAFYEITLAAGDWSLSGASYVEREVRG